jgi:hypothetical protein
MERSGRHHLLLLFEALRCPGSMPGRQVILLQRFPTTLAKAGTAMFPKIISLGLAGILAYLLVESDLDLEQAYYFLLLPASAILSYLVLGAAD